MNEIADRLSKALHFWADPKTGKSDKKTFQEIMQARFEGRGGQRGVSYQSVLSYFDGSSTPSVEWLLEAADVLGVRFAWLVAGEEPRYESTSRTIEAIRGATSGAIHLAAATGGASEPLVRLLIQRLIEARPQGDPEPPEELVRDLAKAINDNVMWTWGALTKEGPATPFVTAVLTAMIAAVPTPGTHSVTATGPGQSISEVIRIMPRPPRRPGG